MRPRRTLSPLALFLFAAACDCGGGGDPAACDTTPDCPAGFRCADGECIPQPRDAGPRDSGHDAGNDAGSDAGCSSAVFCGAPPVCCPAGSECVDDACVPACPSGVRCGTACCDGGQVCVSSACVDPGAPCVDSFDCPADTFCEPTLGRCLPQFDPVTCESTPVFGDFETTLERSMTTSMVRNDCFHAISPATVVDLDGDGIPEIVVNMACDADWRRGIVRAFRGDTGDEIWVADAVETYGRTATGAADLRGDGNLAIVTLTSPLGPDPRRAIALSASGEELWRSTLADGTSPLRINGDNGAPTFADLDGDGRVEIIWGAVVLDADGRLVWQRDGGGAEGTNTGYTGGITAVGDLDGDGLPELVTGRSAYERDGTPKWRAPTPDGYPALAQFDSDPQPEVALVAQGDVYLLDGVSGEVQWGPVALPGGGRGGPPTIADFDGDGLPEIGVAGARSYSVYDPDGAAPVLWSRPTQDVSSNATGSSVFDFEGDGSAEVVYQDECYIWVYAGSDGTVLLQLPSSSATIHEYPLVVDVDADGNSEIVAVANDRSTSIPMLCRAADPMWDGQRKGVFVYGDLRDQWVRTRRVWNQHAYHVTNIASDGTVPRLEPNNWEIEGLNNYRQNVQGEGVFNAPDLEIAGLEVVLDGCPAEVTLRARVRNVGNLGTPAGVPVSFYRGPLASPGPLLGTVVTDVPLLPGASTVVVLTAPLEGEAPYAFHVIVDDDGSGAGVVAECNEDGNGEDIADIDCNLLI